MVVLDEATAANDVDPRIRLLEHVARLVVRRRGLPVEQACVRQDEGARAHGHHEIGAGATSRSQSSVRSVASGPARRRGSAAGRTGTSRPRGSSVHRSRRPGSCSGDREELEPARAACDRCVLEDLPRPGQVDDVRARPDRDGRADDPVGRYGEGVSGRAVGRGFVCLRSSPRAASGTAMPAPTAIVVKRLLFTSPVGRGDRWCCPRARPIRARPRGRGRRRGRARSRRSSRSRRSHAAKRSHRRKAGAVDRRGPDGDPQRIRGRDDVDAGAADVDRAAGRSARRVHLEERHAAPRDPEPVAEKRQALGGRVLPPTMPRRVASLVAVSMRNSVLSRWVMTQAFVPAKTMSAGPSPTGIRAITLFVERGDPKDLGALIVGDPDRAGSGPDVVRGARAERDPLRDPRACGDRSGRASSRCRAPRRSRSRRRRRSPRRRDAPSPSAARRQADPHDPRLLLARDPRGAAAAPRASSSASTGLPRRTRARPAPAGSAGGALGAADAPRRLPRSRACRPDEERCDLASVPPIVPTNSH